MRENWCLLIAAAVVAAALIGGCATCEPASDLRARSVPNSNIIFNPDFNTPVVAGADRDVWPIATEGNGRDSGVDYRETVIDRQGLSNRSRDYYFRRVESERTRSRHQ